MRNCTAGMMGGAMVHSRLPDTDCQVITGVMEGERWRAQGTWSPEAWLGRGLGEVGFRVGDDEQDEPVLLTLADYLWYAEHVAPGDRNPLYLFDHINEPEEEEGEEEEEGAGEEDMDDGGGPSKSTGFCIAALLSP